MAYSASTVKNAMSQINMYLRYCDELGEERWGYESLVGWLLHEMQVKHVAKKTLESKLGHYKWGLRNLLGVQLPEQRPGTDLYLVSRMISRLADDRQPKLPIGLELLQRIVPVVKMLCPGALGQQLAAFYTMTYAGFLRASETCGLQMADTSIVQTAQGAELHFKLAVAGRQVYKTHTQEVQFKCLAGPHKGEACAVAAARDWIAQRGTAPGPLFTVSQQTARVALQLVAGFLTGQDRYKFGLHSLRAGAATDAEAAGAALSLIMFMGRWRSATVLQYLRNGEQRAQVLGARGPSMGVRVAL